MKKKQKLTQKNIGLVLTILLIILLVGTSFQVFMTSDSEEQVIPNPMTVYIAFNITGQNYEYQAVQTYQNISMAEFLYMYARGQIELQSDGSIKRFGQIYNNLETNTFWTTILNNETIIDTRITLEQGDHLFLIYE